MAGLQVSEEELRSLLVKQLEVIGEAEFEKARQLALRFRLPLERALVERGGIPLGFLLKQLADFLGVGFIDLQVTDVQPEALRAVREGYARAHALVPFARSEWELRVAMADPRDERVIDELQGLTGLHVVPFLAPESEIRRAHLLYRGDLRRLLERSVADAAGGGPAARPEDQRSAIDLVSRLLEYAAISRASDIHIEPYELETIVRYRIDGSLREVVSLPPASAAPVVGRIKLLSGMRIDERRAPQDGSFEADLDGFRADFRVSALPTVWGEKVVLRVHSRTTVPLDLEDLGLTEPDYEIVLRTLRRPYGLILVTGPTGSGKTSSLYAMLIRVGLDRANTVNISTVEDPVEYRLPRVNQVQINPAAGVEFATALRSLLRQDPDILMVGEIRDPETAEIAIRAALVGRLVLSTLHTNDATGAVPRLLDIGVEPFLLASTLVLAVSQRLVRRICTGCRESVSDSPALKALRARPDLEDIVGALRRQGVLGGSEDPLAAVRLFQGSGCRECDGSGFRGRLGVFELFEVDDAIREMIMERRPASAIRAAALAGRMKTMFQDGLAKAFLGETTLEEVFRVAL